MGHVSECFRRQLTFCTIFRDTFDPSHRKTTKKHSRV
ncbi:hypothetical protein J2X47_000598 [Sphingomonas sp. BE270]|jgi:hypothetical protein|nr:hypothetical protein [Sphingomonas sp. BE270]